MFRSRAAALVCVLLLALGAHGQQPRLPTVPPEPAMPEIPGAEPAGGSAQPVPGAPGKRLPLTPLPARKTPLELEKEAAKKAGREAISEGLRKAEEAEAERAKRTKEQQKLEEERAKDDSMMPERFVRPLPGMARPSTAYDLPSSSSTLPSIGGSRSLRDQTFVKPLPNQSGWIGTILLVRESALPLEARQTLQLIRKGGPFPYAKDGTIFGNRERRLPQKPRGYYREYTVPTPGEDDRGARRIVAGAAGEYYYTADHYRSFKLVRKQ